MEAGPWRIPRTLLVKEIQITYQYLFGKRTQRVQFFLENSLNLVAYTMPGYNYDFGSEMLIKQWNWLISNCIGPGIKANYLKRMYIALNLGVGIGY